MLRVGNSFPDIGQFFVRLIVTNCADVGSCDSDSQRRTPQCSVPGTITINFTLDLSSAGIVVRSTCLPAS